MLHTFYIIQENDGFMFIALILLLDKSSQQSLREIMYYTYSSQIKYHQTHVIIINMFINKRKYKYQ